MNTKPTERRMTGWGGVMACVAGLVALLPATAADVRRDATVAAVEKVLPSVVNIGTLTRERADPYEQTLREFFGYSRRAPGTVYSSGSGVVIDEEGWVLTNLHVVRDAAEVRVILADQQDGLLADVVSVSEANDLALLRVKAPPEMKFTPVAFAADDDLLLGETVIALGNPYGLGGSVSRGILSSKTRRPEKDGEAMSPEDWLQTDASINPGNSGGPLVNLRGELIGLNVAILAQAQGIGFAIPVKRISAALTEMFAPEATKGLWFGARVEGMLPPVVITQVQPGSPAANAGLQPGDEVVSLNGKPVRSFAQFYRDLANSPKESRVGAVRAEKRTERTVRLVAEATLFDAEYFRRRLGLTLEPVPMDIQRQLRTDLSGALMIAAVDRNGPAADTGLAKGQIILRVDNQSPMDLVTLGRQLNRKRKGESVRLDLLLARRRGMLLQLSEGRAEVTLR